MDEGKKLGGGKAILEERRKKMEALRQRREPAFPNNFRVDGSIAEVLRSFEKHTREELEGQEDGKYSIAVAGRITASRGNFLVLRSGGADLQAYVDRKMLGQDVQLQVKRWDLGDIVGIRGVMRRSNRGDLYLSIRSQPVHPLLLAKGLHPLPEKFHGLQDEELRYRRRYLDWIVNAAPRRAVQLRAQVLGSLRAALAAENFMEVETPLLHAIPGGAAARPFQTRHNALDLELHLRIAPELYLKRLLVGGFERVFELGRCFRNEGLSARHNPEFTMLEFYQAYADYEELMAFIESMLRELVQQLAARDSGAPALEYGGEILDFSTPFARIDMAAALQEHNPALAGRLGDERALRSCAKAHNIQLEEGDTLPRLQLKIFEKTVEQNLRQPTFVQHYPAAVSPLARARDDDPDTAERFELFIAGIEVANGFSELNDPQEQARRFQAQMQARAQGDDEALHYDQEYIEALEYGMPPAAGAGIGIDRLLMLLSDAPSLREVIAFPLLRPERS